MYDPARDIFTASEDGPGDPDDQDPTERRANHASIGKPEQPDHRARDAAGQPSEHGVSELHRNLPLPDVVHKDPSNSTHSADVISSRMPSERDQTASPKPRKRDRSPEGHSEKNARFHSSQVTSNTLPSADGHHGASEPPNKRRKASPPSEAREDRTSRGPENDSEHQQSSHRERPRDIHRAFRRSRSPRRDDRKQARSRSPQRRAPQQRRKGTHAARRSPSPKAIQRTPTPPPRSPPRQRKRPGGASRIGTVEKELLKQRQIGREQEQLAEAKKAAATRGVHDVVRQHYNAVPERGRDWRKTDSRIKGLRSFNNWIKSTIIQRFSPNENSTSGGAKVTGEGEFEPAPQGILVLDIGCGKGGDLGKWRQAPQQVELYVGLDPAEISIDQARERYVQMRGGGLPIRGGGRGGRGRGGMAQRTFQGEFFVKDCFGEWLGDIPIIQEVGIDGSVGPGGAGAISARWGGGGFDVVSMMFCMHYAFESEAKARGMLRNVAGSLKKGGRFLGVIPNSDIIRAKVEEFHRKRPKLPADGSASGESTAAQGSNQKAEGAEAGEVSDLAYPEWGNSIYRVRFPGKTPEDGVFRPPFGWRYSYFMEEAVEEVPEYVVPWEAFRALAEDYNLEQQYRKPFLDVWQEEKDDRILGPLSERMGVRERNGGPLLVSDEEMEAASFYHAFCFYKV
ncbi:MAG: mRNA cap guanine-N7 methyltransferase [Lasallia pustulata]|uniref:mRNA cap guanine-N(7) methyltransferase n=1 Tax=Lasallia pustulata TaxID=136370 RepID=A0A5M8PVC5_9LECA|nr:MAG: mRNA cap guanine-N7 methyltransferase [Lasallia pustulata]